MALNNNGQGEMKTLIGGPTPWTRAEEPEPLKNLPAPQPCPEPINPKQIKQQKVQNKDKLLPKRNNISYSLGVTLNNLYSLHRHSS